MKKSVAVWAMSLAAAWLGLACGEARAELGCGESGWSPAVRVDARSDFGGRLVHGTERMGDAEGGATEAWNTAALADGWQEVTRGTNTATVAVLNAAGVAVEYGRMGADAAWGSGKVHVVRDWVVVPDGRTLEIGAGTVVKFTRGAGILVEEGGTLKLSGTKGKPVRLTAAEDDAVGGDTDMREERPVWCYYVDVKGALEDSGWTECAYVDTAHAAGMTAAGLKVGLTHTVTGESVASEMVRVDVRSGFGGRLVHGTERMGDADGGAAEAWNTTALADGWQEVTRGTNTATVAVLNASGVAVEYGRMGADALWGSGKVHVVRDWVVVPDGRTLEIGAGTVVKFTRGAGILVEEGGTLKLSGTEGNPVRLTAAEDDAVGGDTDMRDERPVWCYYVDVKGTLEDSGWTECAYVDTAHAAGMVAAGLKVGFTHTVTGESVASEMVRVDARSGFGGRLVHGTERMGDAEGGAAEAWNTAVLADGWQDVTRGTNTATVAVLNAAGVAVEYGRMGADTAWGSGKVHVVRDWVVVPNGRTLEIGAGTVVKFTRGTGILVEEGGALKLSGTEENPVWLTAAEDDTVGGDTDMREERPVWCYYVDVKGTLEDSGWTECAYVDTAHAAGMVAAGLKVGFTHTVTGESVASEMVRVDARSGFGGRLVHGTERMGDAEGGAAEVWNTTALADGWQEVAKGTNTATVAVLNAAGVAVEYGRMGTDAMWGNGKVHVVRDWVVVPDGRTLEIGAGTVVKFTRGAGILVEEGGKLKLSGTEENPVRLTAAEDDAVGGDTDMREERPVWCYYVDVKGTLEDSGWTDCRYVDTAHATGMVAAGLKVGLARAEWGESETSDGARVDGKAVVAGVLLTDGGEWATWDTAWDGAARVSAEVEGPDGAVVALGTASNGGRGSAEWTADEAGRYEVRYEARDGDGKLLRQMERALVRLGDDVALHAGSVGGGELWEAGKVHVVNGTVTVGNGVTLTIERGAVVKFMPGAALAVESGGSCAAEGAVFTHINDDTVGGDTMGDGAASGPVADDYRVSGNVATDAATELRWLTMKTAGTLASDTVWMGSRVICVTGNVTVASGATLTVLPGAIVKFNPGVSLTVNSGGTLNALGTRAQPIVFTSIKDDEFGGDTNGDGDSSYPQPGDWARIYAGGTVNMDYCRIRHCNNNSDNGAIQGTGGTVRFDDGVIEYSVYECVRMNSGRFESRNSVFREASMGFGYYGGSGVHVYNGVVADCTIACRASNKHFHNTVFYRCQTFLESTSSSCDHCLFFNPADYGAQSAPQVGSNGNIWGDPQFTDPANGDFRVEWGSACIDAGDGPVAPETDWWGQPRMDVMEMEDTGTVARNGAVPDIGIHEYLPRIVSSEVDLAVTGVAAPSKLTVGETVKVAWRGRNEGVVAAAGPWTDVVELVGANGAVATLGRVRVTGGLAAGGERVFGGEFTVPASAMGRGHVRVTANGDRDLFEGTLTANNVGESGAVEVDLPELAVAGGASASLEVGGGTATAFRVPDGVAAGGGVLVIRTGGNVTVRTGNGVVPTADIHHATGVQIAADTWVVAFPEGGATVYATVENAGTTMAGVEVSVASGALLLFETGARTVPNAGTAGLALHGNGFADGMEVWIEKGGTKKAASEVVVADTVRATAVFDVSDLPEGVWTVHVKHGGTEVSAALLTLKESRVGPKWFCKLDVQKAVRSGREYVGYIEYGNGGDMSLDAPYVKLAAKSGTLLRFGTADVWGDTLELMATSATYPASQLKPGETRRVPFRCKTTGSSLGIDCSYTLADGGTFPWSALGPLMRPSWADDGLWGLSLAILKANVGATWNDYLARMRANCDQLAKIGQETHRLDRIWQLEVNEALGADHAVSTLASATDLVRDGRGFGLALARNYGAGLHRRLRKGVFGYGWSDNYSVWAELQNGGATLALHGGSGSSYRFEKVNGKWAPEDARDKTALTETAGEYVFKYRNGTEMRMSKGNMRVASVKDNQGNALTFAYNTDGTLARVRHTDGQTLSFTYSNGLLVSASDDQGRTARYEYSGGMLSKVTAFNGLVTRYRYFAADGSATGRALRQIAYPDGTTRDYTYDSRGRVATVAVNGTQLMTEIVRGMLGSYTVIAPDGGETAVTVGASGEVLEMVNALGQRVGCSYTEDTLLESVVGPTGKRAKIGYDEDGQAVRATDASGAETLMDYTADFGNLAKVTDARGNSFGYGYDKLGRALSIAYADGTVERIFRNARGDITNSVNRRGQGVSIAHDGEGNVVSMEWEDGRTFTWAYDAKGNVTNATDSVTGAVAMEYDENERLARIVHPKGRGFTYAYDEAGRMTERRSLDGVRECFAYDALGRLATVSDGTTVVLSNAYDVVTGRLATQAYGNGTVVSNAYDALGRIVGITHLKDGKRLAFFEYAYDADGKCVSQTTAEGVETYRYDVAGQLTGVTYPDGTKESFVYDAVGNRVEANGVEYAVNAMNQYTGISAGTGDGAVLKYDLDGNLASVTDAEGTTTYSYDCLNRLVGVTNEEKGFRWSCEYDVFGNRVSVTDNGTTTERLYLQGALPSVAAEYVNGALAVRHILAGAVRIADEAAGGALRYCHGDLLGSVRLVTDGTGAVSGTQSFQAFGETRVASGDTGGAGYVGMLGVEADSTGLLFMRNRYYSARMGRFVQMDPIRFHGKDVNMLRYCQNRVIDSVDPIGLTYVYCAATRPLEFFPWGYDGNEGVLRHDHILVFDKDTGQEINNYGKSCNNCRISGDGKIFSEDLNDARYNIENPLWCIEIDVPIPVREPGPYNMRRHEDRCHGYVDNVRRDLLDHNGHETNWRPSRRGGGR